MFENFTTVYNSSTYGSVCELNQYSLLQQTMTLPKGLVIMSLIIALLLMIQYWVMPLLRNFKGYIYYQELPIIMASILSITFCTFTYMLVYKPTESELYRTFFIGVGIFFIVFVLPYMYINWKNFKSNYASLKASVNMPSNKASESSNVEEKISDEELDKILSEAKKHLDFLVKKDDKDLKKK